jgi:hypothetical protein
MLEPLETWRIPTNRQREKLLSAILAGTNTPRLYVLCDLVGWLLEQGRIEEHDEVIRRMDLAAAIDHHDEPAGEERRAG